MPETPDEPRLTFAAAIVEYRSWGRTQLKRWVDEMTPHERDPAIDYDAELAKLNDKKTTVVTSIMEAANRFSEELGEEALNRFIATFSRVDNHEAGREVRLLARAGYLTNYPALWFDQDGKMVSRPEAARRLLYWLHQPNIQAHDLTEIREGLRAMILAERTTELGFTEVCAIADILGESHFPLISNQVPSIAEEIGRLTAIAVEDDHWNDPELVALYDRLVELGCAQYATTEAPQEEWDTSMEQRKA